MADPAPNARKELDWDLHISVPTQGVGKSVRVTSDESVGALMIKIAEKLGNNRLLSLPLSHSFPHCSLSLCHTVNCAVLLRLFWSCVSS